MTSWDSQLFISGAEERGVDSQTIENAIAAAERIQRSAPHAAIVFTLAHLAQLSDVPYKYLRLVAGRSDAVDPYRVFALKRRIPENSRPARIICAPEPLLMRVQRWISANMLEGAKVHPASVAYTNESRIVKAAKRHCEATWLIKLDVSNFFESILEPKVYKVFLSLGYQPLLAFELARICTRLRTSGNVARSSWGYRIGAYQNPLLGHLPQGAPTSPRLANLCCLEFDDQIAQIAQRHGLRHTRYADDLTLSRKGAGFDRYKARAVVNECYEVMKAHSLWPNRTKTRVVPPGARKVVLGLLVDGREPALPKEFRDNLDFHLHYLQKLGPTLHAQKRGFESVFGLQNHLLGLTAFAIDVDPVWGRTTMQALRRIPWPTPLQMPV